MENKELLNNVDENEVVNKSATIVEETIVTEETIEESTTGNLELSNIASFKAVGTDGNETNVSKDELVTAVMEEVTARMSARNGIMPLSEISTLSAGTDQFEDQLPVVNGVTYVRGLDENRNPVLISAADHAKVVGGLIGFSGLCIKKFVNTEAVASKIEIFGNISNEIILVSMNAGGMDGHYDALIFVATPNIIRVNRFNEGKDASYQTYSISNGVLSVSNIGYGVGAFTAYYWG